MRGSRLGPPWSAPVRVRQVTPVPTNVSDAEEAGLPEWMTCPSVAPGTARDAQLVATFGVFTVLAPTLNPSTPTVVPVAAARLVPSAVTVMVWAPLPRLVNALLTL